MRVFVRISIFIWYFITAMYVFNGARNLDKYFNTDYIGDIAISLLMSCIILRVVILEEQNKKNKEE